MQPVLFKIGTFEVHSFGVMMVLAFLAGIALLRKRASRYGLTPDEASDAAFYVLFAGVLGARLLFILQDLKFYREHPEQLWSLQFQGLTSFGGVLFGFLALVIWAAIKKRSLLSLLDLYGPAFILGHIVGRFGCLLNGCCYGHQCTLPWGVRVAGLDGLYHPAQAYDAIMNAVVLGFILWFERSDRKVGQVAGLVLIGHGITRFVYELWRAGTSSTYWGSLPITEAQAAALLMALIGVAVWFARPRVQTREVPSA